MKSALIILLLNYCAALLSQDLVFTREFDTKRKLVPVQIINNHPGYFYVLRNNKLAHDLTIERRAKPDGEILAFTPLRLDSVNADWFDYEKLEYRFFEYNQQVYFIFEKMLNSRKGVYLKIIDTTGRSSGFIELAILEKDKTVTGFDFEFKVSDKGKLLIIGSQDYVNYTSKKVVMLYDLEKREKIWIKKLPLENQYTGYSLGYTVNLNDDLFYILENARVVGQKRKYEGNRPVIVPVLFYNSFTLVSLLNDADNVNRSNLSISNLTSLKSMFIHAAEKQVTIFSHFTQPDATGEDSPFFSSQAFNNDLSQVVFNNLTPLNDSIKQKLTFYDGTDYDSPADKDYKLVQTTDADGYMYNLAGRSEENYFKELLFWKINLRNGRIVTQEIVPRKIFYFDDRTRFNNLGVTAQQVCKGSYYTFLLEDTGNQKKDARDFNFTRFARQKYLWDANLMAYILRPDGSFIKKRVHTNGSYDFIPLNYSSSQCDFVFYLNNGRMEKFAFLKLDTF